MSRVKTTVPTIGIQDVREISYHISSKIQWDKNLGKLSHGIFWRNFTVYNDTKAAGWKHHKRQIYADRNGLTTTDLMQMLNLCLQTLFSFIYEMFELIFWNADGFTGLRFDCWGAPSKVRGHCN